MKVLIHVTKSHADPVRNVRLINKVEQVAGVPNIVNQSFVRFVLPIEKLIKTYVR